MKFLIVKSSALFILIPFRLIYSPWDLFSDTLLLLLLLLLLLFTEGRCFHIILCLTFYCRSPFFPIDPFHVVNSLLSHSNYLLLLLILLYRYIMVNTRNHEVFYNSELLLQNDKRENSSRESRNVIQKSQIIRTPMCVDRYPGWNPYRPQMLSNLESNQLHVHNVSPKHNSLN